MLSSQHLVDQLIKYRGDDIEPESVDSYSLMSCDRCHMCKRQGDWHMFSVEHIGPMSGSMYLTWYFMICNRKSCKSKLKQITNVLYPDAKALRKFHGFELCDVEKAYKYLLQNNEYCVRAEKLDLDCEAHTEMLYYKKDANKLCMQFVLFDKLGYADYNTSISLSRLQELGCNRIFNEIKKIIGSITGADVAGVICGFL